MKLQDVADRFNEQLRVFKAADRKVSLPAPLPARGTRSARADPGRGGRADRPPLCPACPSNPCPSAQCAGGVLRENVYAERDHPPLRPRRDGRHRAGFDRVRRGTRAAFRIQATQGAGDPPLTLASSGPLHRDHDRRGAAGGLRCRRAGREDHRRATARPTLLPDVAVTRGLNIHARASDLAQGTLLLSTGTRLEAPDVATAAGAGMARLRVSQQPAFMVDLHRQRTGGARRSDRGLAAAPLQCLWTGCRAAPPRLPARGRRPPARTNCRCSRRGCASTCRATRC